MLNKLYLLEAVEWFCNLSCVFQCYKNKFVHVQGIFKALQNLSELSYENDKFKTC